MEDVLNLRVFLQDVVKCIIYCDVSDYLEGHLCLGVLLPELFQDGSIFCFGTGGPNNPVLSFQKLVNDVLGDEARCAGDENGWLCCERHVSCEFSGCVCWLLLARLSNVCY